MQHLQIVTHIGSILSRVNNYRLRLMTSSPMDIFGHPRVHIVPWYYLFLERMASDAYVLTTKH